ncbi:hypothetical protein ACFWF7_13905 [Nocardia sp. NPDC060256]|uniref:hypothetical protein n=1 Tax=unclassified Nocardia TaxID=2637762 RepID=UPI003664D6B4
MRAAEPRRIADPVIGYALSMQPDPITTMDPAPLTTPDLAPGGGVSPGHQFPGTGVGAMIATMLFVVACTAVAVGIIVSMI